MPLYNESNETGSTTLAELAPSTEPGLSPIRDLHRIGGGAADNLQLKPREEKLKPPGISVIQAVSPEEALHQMREAFPKSSFLQQIQIVGSTNEALVVDAGFHVLHVPSDTFPNHYRIAHADGKLGFSATNLGRLTMAFKDTKGL